MPIVVKELPRISFTDFLDAHNLTVVVREFMPGNQYGRKISGNSVWIADIKNVEIGENGLLAGCCGRGKTKEDALTALGEDISGKHLVVDAYKPTRREIDCPIIRPPVSSA